VQRQPASSSANEEAQSLPERPSVSSPETQPMPTNYAEVDAIYQQRLERFAALRNEYNRQRYLAANLGVILVVATVAALVLGLAYHLIPLLLLIPVLIVAFILAFRRQVRLDDHYNHYATLWQINSEGPLRMRRDWAQLPLRHPMSNESSPFAGDLDLLGHASLQHLLNTATTPAGQIRLRGWLLNPAPVAEIRQRQEAVAELSPQIDLRDELSLFGRMSAMTEGAYARFLEWAEASPWLATHPILNALTYISPALVVLLGIAQLTRLTPYPFWLVFIGINLIIVQTQGKEVDAALERVAERQRVFQPYAGLFALVGRQPFSAPLLKRIQADLAAGDLNADAEMRRLGRIMTWGDLRLSLISPFLQWAFLWNFHILRALEGWQARAGRRVGVWLDTLSELEALAALATLAYDNPTWATPTFIPTNAKARLTARNLAHPLLAPDVVVGNDVSVGPPGTFLLVTGSNMSGKSTLLRAIGVNVALAQAGGPVCADEMSLPPLALATSVRVQDSLEYGVSYYMAELYRLKDVVEIAEANQPDPSGESTNGVRAKTDDRRIPLFLLDEILHGTNTSERQIAARSIIRRLLSLGAIGVVSTHDLTLADAPDFAAISSNAHFTEDFARGPDGPSMRFDYKLRPGIATSSNALKLMEIVGLPLE